jgi:hypothetical protein
MIVLVQLPGHTGFETDVFFEFGQVTGQGWSAHGNEWQVEVVTVELPVGTKGSTESDL